MQNKGLVRLFAILLTLVCVFYLSFSVVTSIYESKAKSVAQQAVEKYKTLPEFATLSTPIAQNNGLDSVQNRAYYNYLDSISAEKVYLGYTLRQVREKQLGLGLDLKGGMNVILEVSEADILKALSNYNPDPNFNKALADASLLQKTNSGKTYLSLFMQAYKKIDPNVQLSTIFSTLQLKNRISLSTTNSEVEKVLSGEIDAAISNSFNVLRTRIDRFGVVQPDIQKLEGTGRILISLPGIKEPERVRKLLQGSANLEFWETYDFGEIYANVAKANTVLATLNTGNTTETDTTKAVAQTVKTEVKKDSATNKVDSLKKALGNKNLSAKSATDSVKQLENFRKENPLYAVLQLNAANGQVGRGPVVGYAHAKDTATVNKYFATKQVQDVLPPNLGLRWSVKPINEKEQIFELIAIKYTNRDKRAPLGGSAITDARDDFGQNSAYAEVSMNMNAEGAKTWAHMTKDNIGKSIAIALDGYIYSYPTVQNEITGGSSNITGHFTTEEAKDLANVLKSGKMPAPAHIIQEDVVGPSLGKEAINNGLWSFVIAFILVLLYMIVYYGFIPGLIADIALFINVFFLMGILASFGAVLTLSGIAGIVLTLGMAVDGNVLIYERVREELMAGKTMKKAIQDGFSNAISAIIDANVTTLLTGIILFIFGTGPILGFATTLIIGIVTSFLTSVFLTRMMLEMYANRENAKTLAFTTKFTEKWFLNTKFDFIGQRKIGYIVSAVMIFLSLTALFTKGLSPGIDFSGGRNYIVQFDQKVNVEEVRQKLEGTFDGASTYVISMGSTGDKARISTKYKIEEDGDNVENEIVTKLYNGLKPYLKSSTTVAQFATTNIVNSQKVGPTIADDIKVDAIWAIIFALLVVSIYILIRFNDIAFSIGALASVTHDVIIILGIFAAFWGLLPFSMEIDQAFIAAILTYVGFSVNDTVVIFDRIRENIGLYPKRDRKEIINEALNDTLSRTFSTSMSVFVVLLSIFILGGDTIRGFNFALLVGTVLGVYSTLYVAVPLGYDIFMWRKKRAIAKGKVTPPIVENTKK